tara:strand:- start:2679 stop:3164 length:486 start_codon:yes stop_codon:yes gene_type:complete
MPRKGYTLKKHNKKPKMIKYKKFAKTKRKNKIPKPTYMSKANPIQTSLKYPVPGSIMEIASSKMPKHKKSLLIATVLSTYLGTMPHTAKMYDMPGIPALSGNTLLEYSGTLPGIKQKKITRKSVRKKRNIEKKNKRKSHRNTLRKRKNKAQKIRLIKNKQK